MRDERFAMRVDQEWLSAVDEWRRMQKDLPPRAEAVRRLVNLALGMGREQSAVDAAVTEAASLSEPIPTAVGIEVEEGRHIVPTPDSGDEIPDSAARPGKRKWGELRPLVRKALTAAGWKGNTSKLSNRAEGEAACRMVGIDIDAL